MDNTIIDKETIKAAMGLAAALLVFISTMAGIVNSRLQKAKNAAHRERIVTNIFSFVFLTFSILSLVFVKIYPQVSVYLSIVAVVVYTLNFIRDPMPASRQEIAVLICLVSGCFFMVLAYVMIRVVGLLELMDSNITHLSNLAK